jgi:hypothetical protein
MPYNFTIRNKEVLSNESNFDNLTVYTSGDITPSISDTVVTSNSANWSSAYTNVQSNSGIWTSAYTSLPLYLPLSGGSITGNLSITGNISGTNITTAFNAATATGFRSFATNTSQATGSNSFASGNNTKAHGSASHTEGQNSTAPGQASHAEGNSTTASGLYSHAQGSNAEASGLISHAMGSRTRALSDYAFAGGRRAIALHEHSYVWATETGTFEVSSTRAGQYMISASGGVFIPGNLGIGTDSIDNALTVVGTISTSQHGDSGQWNQAYNIGTTYQSASGILENFTNTTFNELTSLKANNQLIAGKYYRISDFRLMWWNQSVNDTTVKIGLSAEPLIVLALSGNKISHEAKSELYPQDTIYYDVDATSSNSWGTINTNTPIPNFKGWIYRRIDHRLNIDIPWDWRHITINCCRPDMSSISLYNPATTYLQGGMPLFVVVPNVAIVKDTSNKLYYTTVFNNTNNPLTATDWWLPVTSFTEGDTYFVTDESYGFRAFGWSDFPFNIINLPANTGTRIQQPTFTSSLVSQGTFQLTNCKNIKIESGFSSVFLGSSINSNIIGNNFYNNTITDNYRDNIIGNNFYNNTISNIFYENTIGNNFSNNTIGDSAVSNTIENNFSNNTIKNTLYNTIGNGFQYNFTGNNFNYNTIGNAFINNTIRNDFYTNIIGSDFYFNSVGHNFYYNTIGNGSRYNRVGFELTPAANFYSNYIGNSFNGNYIRGDFYWNTIGNEFSVLNQPGPLMFYNVIGNNFRRNIIEDYINIKNVTGATHVYNNYNTRIFSNSDNTARLSYFNNNDQLVVTDPTA